MPANNAFGIALQIGDGGTPTEVFTTIAQLLDVEGPSLERKVIDTTNHGSPNGWMQYLPGLKDGGEVTFSILFDPDLNTHGSTSGLLQWFGATNVLRNFKIVFTDAAPATTWNISGFVSKFTPKSPVEGALTADVTIKVSGQPTFT
jgi:hypothetical protein